MACSLAEAGCSTHEIASVTGHADLAMVQLYTKAAGQKKMAVAALGRLQDTSSCSNEHKSTS